MMVFNTEKVMEQLRGEIQEKQFHMSELSFTTFYYRKLIRMLEGREKLVLFGAGRYGELILRMLRQEGIQTVQCFCDNSVRRIGSCVCGLEVRSLEDVCLNYPDACFVITPKDYENEILHQLVHTGVDIANIMVFNIKNTGMVVE
ncbi:MAG: hypothetical protein HFH76_02695 [Lachnospiraceae bacterium]|jgi:FlaA1/EpsC-like NDP-sugar epimerase|nr:hypothetical protein [Lachnospiraceae bacterium]